MLHKWQQIITLLFLLLVLHVKTKIVFHQVKQGETPYGIARIEMEGRHVDIVCIGCVSWIDVFRLETNIRNYDVVPFPTQKDCIISAL